MIDNLALLIGHALIFLVIMRSLKADDAAPKPKASAPLMRPGARPRARARK